jgi:hypothetical protein
MAKKKTATTDTANGKPSKTDAMKTAMAENPTWGPKEIATLLNDKSTASGWGWSFKPNEVSNLKSRMKAGKVSDGPKRRGRKAGATTGATTSVGPNTSKPAALVNKLLDMGVTSQAELLAILERTTA